LVAWLFIVVVVVVVLLLVVVAIFWHHIKRHLASAIVVDIFTCFLAALLHFFSKQLFELVKLFLIFPCLTQSSSVPSSTPPGKHFGEIQAPGQELPPSHLIGTILI